MSCVGYFSIGGEGMHNLYEASAQILPVGYFSIGGGRDAYMCRCFNMA